MSNYAYVVTKKSKPLPPHFITKFDEDNIIVDYSKKGYVIYFFSNNANKCKGPSGFFKGYYINHEDKYVGFTQKANMVEEYYEGCFINIEEKLGIEGSNIKINADVFGVMPLLYSRHEDFAIVSDSLYFIKKIRESLSCGLSLDYDNYIARTYFNALTSHPLSSSTIAQEIKYGLPGSKIKISLDEQLSFNVIHEGAKNIFKLEDISYVDSIRKASYQLCGLVGGILESKVMPCTFDLTGGLDSRLVLSGASPFFGDDNLKVGSRKALVGDYNVAKNICDSLGIPLNVKEGYKSRKINPGAIWLASNAGLYDTLYASKSQRLSSFKFNAGGHGAEVFKGAFGWKKVSEIGVNYENAEVYKLLTRELEKGLEEFGIDPKDEVGSEWHYLAFRNAIHSSRGTQVSTFYLRPLLMKTLVHNMKVNTSKNSFKSNPVSDMLIHINPELAKFPFDDKRKNVNQEDIERIESLLGKYQHNLTLYTVDKNINTQSQGYLEEVLLMAENDGFNEELTVNNFSKYLNTTMLPKTDLSNYTINYLLKGIYDSGKNNKIRPNQYGTAISRILSLNILI